MSTGTTVKIDDVYSDIIESFKNELANAIKIELYLDANVGTQKHLLDDIAKKLLSPDITYLNCTNLNVQYTANYNDSGINDEYCKYSIVIETKY
ncbi:MAG: hypothetical protein U9N59_06265 [Campylobacterota bacterium]|nr:hypothetical protein [Campylobacterota bacterium]